MVQTCVGNTTVPAEHCGRWLRRYGKVSVQDDSGIQKTILRPPCLPINVVVVKLCDKGPNASVRKDEVTTMTLAVSVKGTFLVTSMMDQGRTLPSNSAILPSPIFLARWTEVRYWNY